MKGLSDRQRLFVEAYLADPNATQAAIKAGYSKKTAKSQGARLLTNVDIRAAVEERIQAAVISADEVLEGIREIATNPGEKASDRLRGYELLGKHLQLFADRQVTEHKGGVRIEVEFIDGDR